MSQYPEVATAFGYPGQDARWTDHSEGAIALRNQYLRSTVQRLGAIDRASLQAGDQLNYDLYLGLIATGVEGLEYQNDAVVRGRGC